MAKEKVVEKYPVVATYVYPNGNKVVKRNVYAEDIEQAKSVGVEITIETFGV